MQETCKQAASRIQTLWFGLLSVNEPQHGSVGLPTQRALIMDYRHMDAITMASAGSWFLSQEDHR